MDWHFAHPVHADSDGPAIAGLTLALRGVQRIRDDPKSLMVVKRQNVKNRTWTQDLPYLAHTHCVIPRNVHNRLRIFS